MRPLLLALIALAAPLARAEDAVPAEPAAETPPPTVPAATSAPAEPPPPAPVAEGAQAPATSAAADVAQAATAAADAATPAPADLPPPPEPPVARTYSGEPPLPPPPGPPAVAAPAVPPTAIAQLPPRVRRGGAGRFGFMLEAGVPQGATASLTYRPLSFVRLWAGPSWDYAGFGAQGGVMLAPFWSWVAPTLSIEAGRFFDADVNPIADRLGADISDEMAPLLRKVRLEYVAAHLGLELGWRHFALSIRAGVGKMRVTARGRGGSEDFFLENPTLVAAVPTVKVGLQTTF